MTSHVINHGNSLIILYTSNLRETNKNQQQHSQTNFSNVVDSLTKSHAYVNNYCISCIATLKSINIKFI